MRPQLAICRHAVASDADALSLVYAHPWPGGVELTLDPSSLPRSMATADSLSALASGGLEIRYHFPLGAFELSDPDPRAGEAALALMAEAVQRIAARGGSYLTVHAALPQGTSGTARFRETIDRLAQLVSHGRDLGVSVCLENLRWGATSEPEEFLELIEGSGTDVTFDVGHAVSSDVARRGFSAEAFVDLLGTRIKGAHVYGHETDRHHPPEDLDVIGPTLDALCDVDCSWWLIELTKTRDVTSTRGLLAAYLDGRFASAPASALA